MIVPVTLVTPIFASCLVLLKMMQISGTTEEAGYPASSWIEIYSLSFTNASTGDTSG